MLVFYKLKHENCIKKQYKYAPAILSSFDVSFTIHSSQSQSHDTITLKLKQTCSLNIKTGVSTYAKICSLYFNRLPAANHLVGSKSSESGSKLVTLVSIVGISLPVEF
jgi:hypothetical protein